MEKLNRLLVVDTLKMVLALVLCTAVGFTESVHASEIRLQPYKYDFGIAKDAGRDAFVICESCPERSKPQVEKDFKKKFPASLAIRTSEEPKELGREARQSDRVQGREEAHRDKAEGREGSCLITTVHFRLNSSELEPSEQKKLLELAEDVKKRSASVDGYTCDLGTESHNLVLSRKRAESVADFLKDKGVKVTDVRGNGKCCPVSAKDRSLNRRVEISIHN